MKKLLTVEQVSEILQIKENTIRIWLREGTLKGVKIGQGKTWRIKESQLEKFIEERNTEEE